MFSRSAISLNSTQKTLKMAPELSKNKQSQSSGKKSSIKDNRPKMIRHSSFPSPKKSFSSTMSKINPASREIDPVDEVDNGGRYIPRSEDGKYSRPTVTIYDTSIASDFHVR